MRVSAKADYAVRAAAELAAADEGPVKGERLAEAQDIPLQFLEHILLELKHARLVRARRGARGGYWLANQSRDREMAYGGLIVQWLARTNERFGFSAKGLVGGGRATLSSSLSDILPLSDRDRRSLGRIDQDDDLNRSRLTDSRLRFREDFFVAEPEVGLLVRLTKRLRLTGGAGYRFTAGEGRNDTRLHGAVGSVGLQIGGGS